MRFEPENERKILYSHENKSLENDFEKIQFIGNKSILNLVLLFFLFLLFFKNQSCDLRLA